MKKKVIKIIIIAIIFTIAIIVGFKIFNFIKVLKLENNIKNIVGENYYFKQIDKQGIYTYTTELWHTKDKEKVTHTNQSAEGITTSDLYKDKNTDINVYIFNSQNDEGKIANISINKSNMFYSNSFSILDISDFENFDFFNKLSILLYGIVDVKPLKTENIDGKDLYVLTRGDWQKIYIDKETNLVQQREDLLNNFTTYYEYEIGSVEEKDVTYPDLSNIATRIEYFSE